MSQTQDLGWIFAPVLDDLLPNASVSLGDPGATSAGECNPVFVNSRGITGIYSQINAVRPQHLFSTRRY
jgi:hypothetical protein